MSFVSSLPKDLTRKNKIDSVKDTEIEPLKVFDCILSAVFSFHLMKISFAFFVMSFRS